MWPARGIVAPLQRYTAGNHVAPEGGVPFGGRLFGGGGGGRLGGLVDIVATLGTAKLQDRRVILQQIGRKYKAVLARQMVEHISITEWSMFAVSQVKQLRLLVLAERLQWGYDPYTELAKALREEIDFAEYAVLKVAEHSRWFGQELIPDGGTHGSLDEFCNRVLAPTFVKWMLL